jgi:ketosteroid isomerase-like protein
MKTFISLFLVFLYCINTYAQTKTNLQKLVETEIAFARAAETKGTKAAFLEFLSDEAVVFRPSEINGKLFWKNQPESVALLVWKPLWADVSSDGKLGYTTGGWELLPKGKTDKPAAFGQYATVWQKQSGGNYKAVLDIGVSFDKSEMKTVWSAPKDAGTGEKSPKNKVDSGTLTDIFSKKQISMGYFMYLADDAVVLRENHQPFYGKKQAFVELEKLDKEFPPDGFLNFNANISPNYGNMLYARGVYSLTQKDKSVKKWNFMQIWKFREGKWQIVLDVFTLIPEKQNQTAKIQGN